MNDKELIKALELARYAIEDAPVATCHQGTLDAAATRLTALAEENARLAAEVARLREALRIVHDWRGLCDENETATFDRIARQFQAETGYVRLGKDAPAALQQDREAAAFAWRRWVDDKNDSVNNVIRAALTARKDGA